MADDIRVGPGEIPPGQEWVSGKYALRFTGGGNLELWNKNTLLWQSGSRSTRAGKMAMQEDGNLVIYDRDDRPLWSTGTHGNPHAYLLVQKDGNVVIYSQDNRPLWHTATYGR